MTTSNSLELADVLNFTEADLLANREGIISERQLKLLRRKRLGMWITLPFYALFSIAITAIPVTFLLIALVPSSRSLSNFLLMLPAILATGAMAAIFWYALITEGKRDSLAYRSDLKEGVVKHVTGQLTKAEFIQSRERVWRMTVHYEELKINKKIFSCFEQYGFYDVYFTPHTRILLATEVAQDTP